jgi:hypothetical protein
VLNENCNLMIWGKLWGVCQTQSCDPPHGLDVLWGMCNTVILKLRGICRTQSCDPLTVYRSLEDIKWVNWNLIAYSLACLLTCTNWVLSCICERLAKHASRIFVVLFETMLASLYMLILVEMEYLCLWWTYLTCLFTLVHILPHGYLLVISLWSLVRIHSCFANLGIMVEYNCLNTCLYTLWSTLILISCVVSHSSLRLCLMSSLPNGERLCTKLVELFANRMVDRRNMIMSI